MVVVENRTKETLHEYFLHEDETDPDVQKRMAGYGSALAFQSGIICLMLGFCKAGILANMLAEPVIVGFTFAAAILIGISQLTFIFNVHVHGESVVDRSESQDDKDILLCREYLGGCDLPIDLIYLVITLYQQYEQCSAECIGFALIMVGSGDVIKCNSDNHQTAFGTIAVSEEQICQSLKS